MLAFYTASSKLELKAGSYLKEIELSDEVRGLASKFAQLDVTTVNSINNTILNISDPSRLMVIITYK